MEPKPVGWIIWNKDAGVVVYGMDGSRKLYVSEGYARSARKRMNVMWADIKPVYLMEITY